MHTAFSEMRECRDQQRGGRGLRFLRNFFLLAAVIPISIVGIVQWRMVRQTDAHASLARDLIEKGLTVAEVERLLYGEAPYWERQELSHWSVEHAKIEANLKRDLAQAGLSGDEIERVLRATTSTADGGHGKPSASTVDRARKDAFAKKDAAQQMQKTRQADREAAIRELIRRGYTDDDIERLLSTKQTIGTSGQAAPTAAP